MNKNKSKIVGICFILVMLVWFFPALKLVGAYLPEQQILFSQTAGTSIDSMQALYPGGAGRLATGQTINDTDPVVQWNITDVSFSMRSWGSPYGNSTCRIWNATAWPTGGNITGSQLGQSAGLNISSIPVGPGWTWINYSFSGGVVINGLQAVVIAAVTPETGLVNGVDYYQMEFADSNVSQGNFVYDNSAAWGHTDLYDLNIIVYGYFAGPTPPPVAEDLSNFYYRRQINLVGENGSGTDYQVKFIVHNGTGTETNNNIWLNNKTRADFGDVRFSDGVNMLPYWEETGTLYSGHNNTFWVKVTADLSVNQTIYIYYQNSTATSRSNGPATFRLFDDFNDGNINTTLWAAGTGTESAGMITVSSAIIGHWQMFHSVNTYPVPMAMEYSAKLTYTPAIATINLGVSNWYSGIPWANIYCTSAFRSQTDEQNFSYCSASGSYLRSEPQYAIAKDALWQRCSLRRTGINDALFLDGESHVGIYPTTQDRYVSILVNAGSSYSVSASMDWCAVRKYVEPVEPYMGSIGGEEYNTVAFWIDNMEGCGNWLFTETRNYNFRLNVSAISPIDTVFVNFADGAQNNLTLYWDNVTSLGGIYNRTDLARIPTDGTSATYTGGYNTTILWQTWLLSGLIDKMNVDVNYAYNLSNGVWFQGVAATAYFNLYSKGGLTETYSSGSAGHLTGQDVFDLYAHNNSWVNATMIWRALQHVKMRPEITCKISGLTFNLTYGVDYCTGGSSWITGWSITLMAESVNYGSEIWINLTAVLMNHGAVIRTEQFYCYHGPGDGENENTTFILWVDLWFNKVNASSVVGARINAYFYPMTDASSSWLRWLTGSNWGMDDTLQKETLLFDTMQDGSGNVLHASQIKLEKFWCKLLVDNTSEGYTQYVEVKKYEIFDMDQCNPPLEGIQTPVFEETKVIVMPQGGFLGTLWSALSTLFGYLANVISVGALAVWQQLVNYLDVIAAWTGYPKLFSNFFTWLTGLWAVVNNAALYFLALLTSGWAFITSYIGYFITLVTMAFTAVGNFINGTINLFTGTWGYGVSAWNQLNILAWIELVLVLYPIYLAIMLDEQGFGAVQDHLEFVFGIFMKLGQIFWWILTTFIQVLGAIIESIPVVE